MLRDTSPPYRHTPCRFFRTRSRRQEPPARKCPLRPRGRLAEAVAVAGFARIRESEHLRIEVRPVCHFQHLCRAHSPETEVHLKIASALSNTHFIDSSGGPGLSTE